MELKKIRPNPDNPRTISERDFEKLKKSIKEFPKMMELRPIVIDEDGVILGGNMRYEAMKALGFETVPASWVKTAKELTEAQKREFVIKDNSGFGDWDWEAIANEWDDLPLSDWGLEVPTFEDVSADEQPDLEKYTQKVDAPIYEPKGEKPALEDLYNETRTDELITKIEKASVSSELKFFLKKAAQRQRVFHYDKIAEFYSHLEKEEQELFEDAVLVIIDFDDAIANGYVRLSESIAEVYKRERDSE